jgi:hypothetical protein
LIQEEKEEANRAHYDWVTLKPRPVSQTHFDDVWSKLKSQRKLRTPGMKVTQDRIAASKRRNNVEIIPIAAPVSAATSRAGEIMPEVELVKDNEVQSHDTELDDSSNEADPLPAVGSGGGGNNLNSEGSIDLFRQVLASIREDEKSLSFDAMLAKLSTSDGLSEAASQVLQCESDANVIVDKLRKLQESINDTAKQSNRESQENSLAQAESDFTEAQRNHDQALLLLESILTSINDPVEKDRRRKEVMSREAAKLEAARTAMMEARQKAIEIQQKLQQLGLCPAGFAWCREGNGWICMGGTHFVRDEMLQFMK